MKFFKKKSVTIEYCEFKNNNVNLNNGTISINTNRKGEVKLLNLIFENNVVANNGGGM